MLEFFTIAILHLFAVASPGPDFLLVTRQSLRSGRTAAIWSSAGVATGILFHSLIAIIGVSLIIGCLSFFSTSSSSKEKDGRKNENHFGAYILGFFTNILNPKAILFFVTVYTVVVNQSTTKLLLSFYGLYMSVTTFIWFAGISYIFSNRSMTNKYQNFIPIFEKVIGVILIIIAIQLFL